MKKSRLAESFSQICSIISFVFHELSNSYPPLNHQVQDFMCCMVILEIQKIITKSPLKKGGLDAEKFSEKRLASIWNHCLVFTVLQVSINKCELWFLSFILAYSNSIVNKWVIGQNRMEISLKKLA
jgi:hypothetical protein